MNPEVKERSMKEYKKILLEGGLFFSGPTKGSFILPPNGLKLWENIQNSLNNRFIKYDVQNVILPTLIPRDLLKKEENHIQGFSPEFFQIEKTGDKKLSIPLVLRPTSEVLFYNWYRLILQTYHQLPFLYNQWCSVFRSEENTNPFLRNSEFLWQEGHTLHETESEAKQLTKKIWEEYIDYLKNDLCIGVIYGKKSEKEKFAGALETYAVECLLPDGQCLQIATSHYFGDSFCQALNVKFQNRLNKKQSPFSTSWGTSTRAIGALAWSHSDDLGLILPFEIAPIQIAFIILKNNQELFNYYQKISNLLSIFRCKLYNKSSQVSLNIFQADKEGCPVKIILGLEELNKKKIILVRRDDIKNKISLNLEEKASTSMSFVEQNFQRNKIIKLITQEAKKLKENLYQRSEKFLNKSIYKINNIKSLKTEIEKGIKGLFLVPFCNFLNCEKTIKQILPAYSIRCIATEKISKEEECIFCNTLTINWAFLGRSY